MQFRLSNTHKSIHQAQTSLLTAVSSGPELEEVERKVDEAIIAITKLQRRRSRPVSLQADERGSIIGSTESDQIHLERKSQHRIPLAIDFTTNGNTGNLGCPFALKEVSGRLPSPNSISASQGHLVRPDSLPTPPSFEQDPIAAEFHYNDFVSPPASASGSANKCPIRFLDQHSPEELAKYFENHKHEIPRSHEICVKRYQTNEETLRQLDAKYGNLVSMIQGLGVKHKPMLATKGEEDEGVIMDRQSKEKVAKWATSCSEKYPGDMVEGAIPNDGSDIRSGHFDRPLKDVRFGESPSRPWGIQVPYMGGIALSSNPNEEAEVQPVLSIEPSDATKLSPEEVQQEMNARSSKCPFGYGATKTESHSDPRKVVPELPARSGSGPLETHDPTKHGPFQIPVAGLMAKEEEQPKMVFTGPVFIGYSAEQAASILKNYQQPAAL